MMMKWKRSQAREQVSILISDITIFDLSTLTSAEVYAHVHDSNSTTTTTTTTNTNTFTTTSMIICYYCC